MTPKRRNKLQIKTIVIMGSLIGCFSYTFGANTYIEKLEALMTPIQTAIDKNKTDSGIFKEIMENFCKTMTDGDAILQGSGSYSAKNSLFMFRLCNDGAPDMSKNIKRGEGLSTQANEAYTAFEEDRNGEKRDILKEQLPDIYRHTNKYMDELFNAIAESYTNVYQASIYGQMGGSKEDTKKLIETFSKNYFTYNGNKFISICDNSQIPNYPKTCNKLKSYLSKAKNNLNNSSNILNVDNLYAAKDKNNCVLENKNYNTIVCGLYKNDMVRFINLVYNELFFYTSFAQYYSYILDKQPGFKAGNVKDQTDQLIRKNQEIASIQQNISDSRQAIAMSVRMIKELQMTFPVHIGMLLYTEAINTFVFNFNKTLIPIYTIGDIFRNVQDTK